jgi:hypothetical protein
MAATTSCLLSRMGTEEMTEKIQKTYQKTMKILMTIGRFFHIDITSVLQLKMV